MKLLNLENYEIKVTDEALLVEPIRRLFNKDKSETKEAFFKQMSILYFLKDPRSNYSYILKEEDRLKEILIQEGLPKNYKISKDLQDACDIYEKLTMTTSLALLQDVKLTVDKVREFLRNIDLYAVDDKGKPLYTIQSVTSTIKMIPQLSKDLADAEKSLAREIEEDSKARGGGELTIGDTGI